MPLTPMQPELAPEPFHRPGWVYEEKYDGWRIVAYKDGQSVRLMSRTGVDHAPPLPRNHCCHCWLATAPAGLDGEVCVFDDQLISQIHLLGRDDPSLISTPPIYMVFDC